MTDEDTARYRKALALAEIWQEVGGDLELLQETRVKARVHNPPQPGEKDAQRMLDLCARTASARHNKKWGMASDRTWDMVEAMLGTAS